MKGIFKLTSGKYSAFALATFPRIYQFSRVFVNLEDARMCRKALEYTFHGEFAYEPNNLDARATGLD